MGASGPLGAGLGRVSSGSACGLILAELAHLPSVLLSQRGMLLSLRAEGCVSHSPSCLCGCPRPGLACPQWALGPRAQEAENANVPLLQWASGSYGLSRGVGGWGVASLGTCAFSGGTPSLALPDLILVFN